MLPASDLWNGLLLGTLQEKLHSCCGELSWDGIWDVWDVIGLVRTGGNGMEL